MIDHDFVNAVADLLMGAAYADERLRGHEALTIRKKLADLLDVDRVPADVERRLASFDPATFDLDAAVASMPKIGEQVARQILEMVAAVHAADGELDLDEDRYLHRVAEALGLRRASYVDLSLDVEAGEAAAAREPSKPPPVPKKP